MSVRSAVVTQRNIGDGMLPSIRPDLLPPSTHHVVFGMVNSRGKLIQRRRLRAATTVIPVEQIIFGALNADGQ